MKTLEEKTVAVVAGFQGVDDDGNITTLGRGGSDTSAVAVRSATRRCSSSPPSAPRSFRSGAWR
jgi:aspartokinase